MTVLPPPPPLLYTLSQGLDGLWPGLVLTLLDMRLSQKTLRACYGPAARIKRNKPRR